MNSENLEEKVLAALKPRGSRIVSLTDLARGLFGRDADEESLEALRLAVARLERRGAVVRVRGQKLSLIEFTSYKAGRIAVRGEGRGWLLSGEKGVPDLPIARGGLAGALDGDVVLVHVERRKPKHDFRGPLETGVVEKVLVRRRETLVGRIARGAEGTVVVPFDTKVDALFRVPHGLDLDAPEGIYVDCRILSFPDDRRTATAEVTELIGFPGEPGVDVEVVARKWGLPRAFPDAVLAEAEAARSEIGEAERRERKDFTSETIVTIDGETARDFDDAIGVEELPGGRLRVGVHIADVSHYVRPGTALDAEAWERGTSVYFPDRAIPMLPERLSNDLCSLRPGEEKRTVSAVLTLDERGETVEAEFFRSVIRSRARLTYTCAAAFLEGGAEERAEAAAGLPDDVKTLLPRAARAAALLRGRRERRGSLDFDLPDADLILGESGDVVDIVKATRNVAHRLIEELMLAANEAVARHLDGIPMPALYRVHDQPDERRLGELREVLEPFGILLPPENEDITPAVFQRILDQAEGTPEERFVDELVLRSQKKALYAPDCRGHYALAAEHYAHFTSPIRRYPDLVVHRALCEWIATRRAPSADEADRRTMWLDEAAPHTSERERRAESAEREAQAWKKFVFLEKRVGDAFDARVSAVTGFGLFVLLDEVYADGLVPIDVLGNDFFRYEEAGHRLVGVDTGKVFRLGDPLRVTLFRADPDKRQLEFHLEGVEVSPRRLSRDERGGPPRGERRERGERAPSGGRRGSPGRGAGRRRG